MKIEWLPVAEEDLDSQLTYIEERNPWAAIDMGDAVEAAVLRLEEQPRSGRPGRVRGHS